MGAGDRGSEHGPVLSNDVADHLFVRFSVHMYSRGAFNQPRGFTVYDTLSVSRHRPGDGKQAAYRLAVTDRDDARFALRRLYMTAHEPFIGAWGCTHADVRPGSQPLAPAP